VFFYNDSCGLSGLLRKLIYEIENTVFILLKRSASQSSGYESESHSLLTRFDILIDSLTVSVSVLYVQNPTFYF
jgi:hypothetical protein